ncbi:MAG: hypothetical protein GEU74_00210 [Nitriliruptorales bacterium]|nr:hypothetical protein [Nitriliruptorales bacterium]
MNIRFLLAFSAGYVLGARAGRERYDEIVTAVRDLMDSDLAVQFRSELPRRGGHGDDAPASAVPPVVGT